MHLFTLTSADLTGTEMATAFCKALTRIARVTRDKPGPTIYSVYRDGRIKKIS